MTKYAYFYLSLIIASRARKVARCGLIGMAVYALVLSLASSAHGAGTAAASFVMALVLSLFTIWLPVGIVAFVRACKSKEI
jgi:hypothetical protein